MPADDVADLVRALCADPDARWAVRDALIERNLWDWPTVRSVVCDNPVPDGPRWLARDWFEHAGDAARAEFIDVQMALVKYPPTVFDVPVALLEIGEVDIVDRADPRQRESAEAATTYMRAAGKLRRRMDELLLANRDGSWSEFSGFDVGAPFDGLRYGEIFGRGGCSLTWKYRRGFVEFVTASWKMWAGYGDRVRGVQPVRRVVIEDGATFDEVRWEPASGEKRPAALVQVAGQWVVPRTPPGGDDTWLPTNVPAKTFVRSVMAERWPGIEFVFALEDVVVTRGVEVYGRDGDVFSPGDWVAPTRDGTVRKTTGAWATGRVQKSGVSADGRTWVKVVPDDEYYVPPDGGE